MLRSLFKEGTVSVVKVQLADSPHRHHPGGRTGQSHILPGCPQPVTEDTEVLRPAQDGTPLTNTLHLGVYP